MYKEIGRIRVWGDADSATLMQANNCAEVGDVAQVCLMADNHKGYSQPIGGVVAYRNAVSPSGVGYDIGCGNKAVRTNLKLVDIYASRHAIMDDIARAISFGVGRNNPNPIDHPLFDSPTWRDVPELMHLKQKAKNQLGTVGSGNHYVDVLYDVADQSVWVGVHFGSRGFGHSIATGFLNMADNRPFDARGKGEKMDAPPTLLSLDSELGQAYMAAMRLAGQYAYAGRDYVVSEVLKILGAKETYSVHNHHNYAWVEWHNGEQLVVVRKGATPNQPYQDSFVGGSMAGCSVILQGNDTEENVKSLYSTVHGAGRIMSRTQAAGRMNYKLRKREGGKISPEMMYEAVRAAGVVLRGGGTDESPMVYRNLITVLQQYTDSFDIKHMLRPIGVCMAGANEFDPYKD